MVFCGGLGYFLENDLKGHVVGMDRVVGEEEVVDLVAGEAGEWGR